MDNILNRLKWIRQIQILLQIKDDLKNDALDPMLKWHERMDLYDAIQGIDERIRRLQTYLQKAS